MTTGTWAMIAEARADLAAYLETLSPEQWDAPSLCAEWSVRHVVAHVIQATSKVRVSVIVNRVLRRGFTLNGAIATGASEHGEMPRDLLLKQLRWAVNSEMRPPTTTVESLLGDVVVHTQDIRRALGSPGTIPEERLRVTLDHMCGVGGILGNNERIRGLTLCATDIDWASGAGAEVVGPGEALLMAMCGRKDALANVTGDGVAILRGR
jgi:uncharacterized protein (TIGR03083 family)